MMGGDQKQTTEIQVECYAGSHSEESPRSFSMGHSKIKVSEIIDRWLDPAHSYFKVRGDDGGIYILRYDQESDVWEMIMFNSDKREETRLSST
jgi:hypothetical protein